MTTITTTIIFDDDVSWFYFYSKYDLDRKNPRDPYKTVDKISRRQERRRKVRSDDPRNRLMKAKDSGRVAEGMLKRRFCEVEENERDSSFAREGKEEKFEECRIIFAQRDVTSVTGIQIRCFSLSKCHHTRMSTLNALALRALFHYINGSNHMLWCECL